MYHDKQPADGDDNRRGKWVNLQRSPFALRTPTSTHPTTLHALQHCTALHTAHCTLQCTLCCGAFCLFHYCMSLNPGTVHCWLLYSTSATLDLCCTGPTLDLSNTGLTFDASQFTLFLNLRVTLRWSTIAFNPTALHRWFQHSSCFQRKCREVLQ